MGWKRVFLDFTYVIVILLLISILFWISGLDIYLESFFYSPETGWFLKDNPVVQFIYTYSPVIPLIIFLISFILLIISVFVKKLKKYRKIFLFLFLFMLIGSGIISNYIFKDHWGRPRPREIVQFGGEYNFVPHWFMGNSGKNSSFPSGHASAAFFMIFPYFLYRNRYKKKAYIYLVFGLIYGFVTGLIRMIQGGHFASDVIWAGGFMYLTALVLYYLLKMNEDIYLKK